jgi:hypothetical protein
VNLGAGAVLISFFRCFPGFVSARGPQAGFARSSAPVRYSVYDFCPPVFLSICAPVWSFSQVERPAGFFTPSFFFARSEFPAGVSRLSIFVSSPPVLDFPFCARCAGQDLPVPRLATSPAH